MDMLSDNNKENLESADINEKKPVILLGFMLQNRLLNKLGLTFKQVTFSKSKFLASIPILKTRYRQSKI